MNSKTLYYIMLGGICVMLIGLVGGAYAADKLLTAESNTLVANRLDGDVLDEQQSELLRAKQEIKKYQELANIAKNIVPQDKDQAQTIRQIVSIANTNGVALSSITFPSSTLGAADKKGAADLSQLSPVKDVAGVYSLQLTVQSDVTKPVPYSKFISFLDALEHNRRTALVQSITIQPDTKNRSNLSFALVLSEYIKP